MLSKDCQLWIKFKKIKGNFKIIANECVDWIRWTHIILRLWDYHLKSAFRVSTPNQLNHSRTKLWDLLTKYSWTSDLHFFGTCRNIWTSPLKAFTLYYFCNSYRYSNLFNHSHFKHWHDVFFERTIDFWIHYNIFKEKGTKAVVIYIMVPPIKVAVEIDTVASRRGQ